MNPENQQDYFNIASLHRINLAGGSTQEQSDSMANGFLKRYNTDEALTRYLAWLFAGFAAGYIGNHSWTNIANAQTAARSIIVAFSMEFDLDNLILPTAVTRKKSEH